MKDHFNDIKFLETRKITDFEILTDEGYAPVSGINKTIKYKVIEIFLEGNLSLKCADTHILIKDNFEQVYAKDSLHEYIHTKYGLQKVKEIKYYDYEENMYDIELQDNCHVYYTNDILSHNTVVTAIYLLHKAIFRENVNIGIVANVKSLAKEVLDKIKKIYVLLPIWLQIGVEIWNKETIELENNTRIMTAAANDDAFRGYTINYLYCDENAFISTALWEELSDSIFPSQHALAEHQTIISSTAKGYNHWYQLVKGARAGRNGYKLLEINWKEVPRWNKDGTRKDPEVFKQEIIASKGLLHWKQNFENVFLGSSNTLISSDALANLIATNEYIEKYIDGLRVYKLPQKDHKYIISVDPAKDGQDAFALHVIDVTQMPFEQVACADLQISYLEMPTQLYNLGIVYNQAYMIIENNEGAGQSINDTLFAIYEYENLYRGKDNNNKYKKYYGFRTTTKTKKQILNLLKIFIENDKLIIHDEKTIIELYNFVSNGKSYAADEGYKDDLVMALALAFGELIYAKSFAEYEKFIELLFNKEEFQDKEEESKFEVLFTFASFEDGSDVYIEQSENKYLFDVMSDVDQTYEEQSEFI